jgi:hypothetical protein
MLEKLTFEVTEAPVLYNFNGEIIKSDSHKAIIKEDNGSQLSVMKNSYKVMRNEHFEESVNRMMDISGFEHAGYTEFDGGRVIIAHLKNNRDNIEIGGNKIDDYLTLGTSHDGRYPFFIGTTTHLLRCKNQFSRMNIREKVRHTQSSPKKRDELLRSLEIYFRRRDEMYNNFDRMRSVEVNKEIIEEVEGLLLNIKKFDRWDGNISTRKQNKLDVLESNILLEMKDLGENLWGIFQGVTRYTTHDLKQKERVFGNLLGTSANINNKMYEYAIEMIN